MKNQPIIIVGDGGHSTVLFSILQLLGKEVLGATSITRPKGDSNTEMKILGSDDEIIKKYPPDSVKLVNGIGSIKQPTLRKQLFNFYKTQGYLFSTLIHPSAIIDSSVHLEEGAQVLAGSIINTHSSIGVNTIINSGSVIEHHNDIGEHSHISPNTTLCGGCVIGELTHIGAGATVIQGINIGSSCLVAAGAVVAHDLPAQTQVRGVPAKPF